MYVDESGDTGLDASPPSYFALSGLIVHESRWRDLLNQLIAFKRTLRDVYGLPLKSEIHAAEFINGRVSALGGTLIGKPDKLALLRNALDELRKIDFISITNVIVDKRDKLGRTPAYDVFDRAWIMLFQRFENTMAYGNFPGGYTRSHGMVITDATAGTKLLRMVRRMAVYNPITNDSRFGGGNRNMPIVRIIEDQYGKDSKETLPLQMADVVAYFLHQKFKPNAYIRKQRAHAYFDRLRPVLNLHASRRNSFGIVTL